MRYYAPSFQSFEVFAGIHVGPLVSFVISPAMTRHRIYIMASAQTNNVNDFSANLGLTMTYQGKSVGVEAVNIQSAAQINRSLPGLVNIGGNAGRGAIQLFVNTPFFGVPAKPILQPTVLNGTMDGLIISVTRAVNMNSAHFWVGVYSEIDTKNVTQA